MSGHAGFVALAYGVTVIAVGGVVARIVLDYRRLRAELARFGARGQRDEGGMA